MSFLLRILATGLGFAAALWIIPGFQLLHNGAPIGADRDTGTAALAVGVLALIFGVINATVRPVIAFLSLPITCLTLGLFTLVINAAMLALTAWLSNLLFPFQLDISGFWAALFAALVISLVSAIANRFIAAITAPVRA
ncbi:phage holin family protein [Citricoccus sp. NR2]|uniref:phage holin family protein n=1 Tax=Citricoccus sp. NR2 TaxID=3004095 RepID=UPI0022DD0D4C|nr:phage holin family protein [Citricoccus sp. NR2]WBL20149.1 phage holin family protein [Citricoccus sp. NR2]